MTEFLTVNDVARLFHVHETTVRRRIKAGRIRAVRMGRRLRVPLGEIERWSKEATPSSQPVVPVTIPPTAEEIARRRRVVAGIRRLREEIGPIGVSVTDLFQRDGKSTMRDSSRYVVDASVAAKWDLNDEEYQDPAYALLIDYQEGRTQLIAPDHLRYEVANTLT
jgi:excisionase family DNA binding protein